MHICNGQFLSFMNIDMYEKIQLSRRAKAVLYPSDLCHVLTLLEDFLILYCTCYEICVQWYEILSLCFCSCCMQCVVTARKKDHCISTKSW